MLFRPAVTFFWMLSKLPKQRVFKLVLIERIEKCQAMTDWGCMVIREALRCCVLPDTRIICRTSLTQIFRFRSFSVTIWYTIDFFLCPNASTTIRILIWRSETKSTLHFDHTIWRSWIYRHPARFSSSMSSLPFLTALCYLNIWKLDKKPSICLVLHNFFFFGVLLLDSLLHSESITNATCKYTFLFHEWRLKTNWFLLQSVVDRPHHTYRLQSPPAAWRGKFSLIT